MEREPGNNSAEQYERQSFDLSRAVRLLRYDYQETGYAREETRQRILDEDMSFMAEAADGPARTSYVFQRGAAGELLQFNNGRWMSHTGMLLTGLEVARTEARADPRRRFLVDWAVNDQIMGYKMRQLQPGQRLSWTNGFPHDVAAQYGDKFVRDCGLRPDRQMGFLYQAVCHDDGAIELISQTVDRSDSDALQAVERAVRHDPDLDMDGMLKTYDGSLRLDYGGHFFAGNMEYERQANVWKQIISQQDLTAFYLAGLEVIARGDVSDQITLQKLVKDHVIGSWTLFEKRLRGELQPTAARKGYQGDTDVHRFIYLREQAEQGRQEFRSQLRTMDGCGGSLSLEQLNDPNGPMSDIRDSIFKATPKPERYSFSKLMYCVSCQAPPEEKAAKKMCGPCGICRPCDRQMQTKSLLAGMFALAA